DLSIDMTAAKNASNAQGRWIFVCAANPFLVDSGVTVTPAKTADIYAATSSNGLSAGEISITVRSGSFGDVDVFHQGAKKDITGNARITVSGTADINNLVVARACYHTITNAFFDLQGGKVTRFIGSADRPRSGLISNPSGVTDNFIVCVSKDFDASAFAGRSGTTFFGLSGITVATYADGSDAATYLDGIHRGQNYVLAIDEEIYDTLKNDATKVQAEFWDKIVKDAPSLRTASLTLDGKIGLNFYVFVSSSFKAANPNGYAKLEGPEGETTVLLADAPVDAHGNSKFTYAVAAKDMREDVTISFFDGNDQPLPLYDSAYNEIAGGSYTYTVGDYLAAVDGDASQSAEMKALAEALSDYNACAELLFGTGTPAAPSLGNMDLSSYKATLTGDLPAGVTLTGMTLLLESETTLRVYFKLADGAALPTVTVDETEASPVSKDGQYYIAIENIAAPDLGVAHSIAIGGCTVSASALSYSASVLANAAGNEPLCNTAKALANYYIAADAYFN
ncbi:MAG: hypothetical protein II192_07245, partial [Clostridia bacterium]|nr:hypothetical protein [Clostridia bacterium]